MGRKIANLGYRGLLLVVSGVASLAGAACALYGPAPEYGMPIEWDASLGRDADLGGADAAYGPPTCSSDTVCKNFGADWYCNQATGTCEQGEPDAGKDGG